MAYEYRITRISPNNNVASEKSLNDLGKEGFKVVAWSAFNMDIVLVLGREVGVPSSEGRRVTVKAPEG